MINSCEFSDYELAVYCVLKMLTVTTYIDDHYITPKQIEFYLTGKLGARRTTDNIKAGLLELINKGIVSKKEDCNCKGEYILDCSNLWLQEKKTFTIIDYSEIIDIFQISGKNGFKLLRYFISLIGTISSKIEVYTSAVHSRTRVVGTFTIDRLSELSGVSQRSIVEYNKMLEDAGLIYIYRQGDFTIDGEKNIRQLQNVYGRLCDKEYVDAFAKNQRKYSKSFKHTRKSTGVINNNRRLAQMYNQLVKLNENNQEIKYSNSEIQDVYNYVISENKKYNNMYDKDGYEKYLDKIRDVDIFDKYDFISKQTEK